MKPISKAAARLFDKLKPYVHQRHYLICESPLVDVGDIGIIPKSKISGFVGLSGAYTRRLLNELCEAGYIAYFHVGDDVKVALNPECYRVNEKEPSPIIVSTFREHARIANDE